MAKQSRSFEALRTFRGQYGLGQGVDDLVAEAKSTEATLYFNERTRPLDAVLAYRRFLELYPDAKEAQEVRRLERIAAFRDAKALNEISAFERFLETYGHTSNERDPLSQEAYALLATKVFVDEAMVEDTVDAHRSFQQ